MSDEIVTNECGGMQARIATSLTLFPPRAWLRVGEVLAEGAKKYAIDNWRLITFREHLDHALEHIALHMAGDQRDDHIGHFACRAMMALEMYLEEQNDASDK